MDENTHSTLFLNLINIKCIDMGEDLNIYEGKSRTQGRKSRGI